MKPWHLTTRRHLGLRDRLRLLFGVPLFVRFMTPDGKCHAACRLDVLVQDEWPGDGCWPETTDPSVKVRQ